MAERVDRPKIGVPRVYPPGALPVLYPGERAGALFKVPVKQLMRDGQATLTTDEIDGWVVEPLPGCYGLFLRWRYRLVYQWLERWFE